ncbi:hypothetical protein BC834DRAFT_851316 [Gloeopeniophorella convolvens]|nr:hypothetical protein BC834DRAFT_851316 [Gloeopeniophorella convolvens]
MPLDTAADPSALTSWADIKENFVIFYSSRDENGRMWCPDCRDVEGAVERAFAPVDGPSGLIIYVGQKAEWKTEANAFRAEPWRVESVPTIVKLRDAVEAGRLVDDEIAHGLSGFVDITQA